jgi:hypothetical protein
MKVLELFSGRHKSFSSEALRQGHEVFTVDSEEYNAPSLVMDIGKMTLFDLPERWRSPDVIWASPPCTKFSIASIGKHWLTENTKRTPRNRDTAEMQLLVAYLMGLIHQLNPNYWLVENPRGMLRKLYPMNQADRFKGRQLDVLRDTVTYCQYGDTRMKPTDIWFSNSLLNIWSPRPMCKNGDPCHVSAPRGSMTGTQNDREDALDRSRVPQELCREILEVIASDKSIVQGSLL